MPRSADYFLLRVVQAPKKARPLLAAIGAVLLVCGWSAPGSAGTVVSAAYAPSASISEPDTAVFGVFTGAPNATDIWSPFPINATGNTQNLIQNANFWQTAGSIDLICNVSNSAGTTRYVEVPDVTNFTPNYITGYQWELGFSSGANFVRSDAGGSLTFNLTPAEQAAYNDFFTTNNMPWCIPQIAQDDFLKFNMSSFTEFNPPGVTGQAPGVEVSLIQSIVQVPDNLNLFNPDGLNQFTIRITAIPALSTPEPAGCLLLATSAAALALAGMRRRQ